MERKDTVMVIKKSARKTQEHRWKNKKNTAGRDYFQGYQTRGKQERGQGHQKKGSLLLIGRDYVAHL